LYLPLSGFDSDREKNRRKMSVNSISPLHNPYIVQPVPETGKAHQQTEGIQDAPVSSTSRATDTREVGESQAVQDHYSPDSMSTQDFMALKSQTHDGQFQALDSAIERIKENADQMGDLVEALHKMSEMADPDNLALQVLTKTLEAMDEARGEK
jgi:hypothetical protein